MAKKNNVMEVEATTEVTATTGKIDLTKKVKPGSTIDLTKVDETIGLDSNGEVATTTEEASTVIKQPTKSDLIRSMYQEGMSVAEIAKATDSHYSFVYGVVKNFLGGAKPTSEKGPSRSDEIRRMSDEGHTPGEIAKALNANYSFVHTVVKKHRASEGGNN